MPRPNGSVATGENCTIYVTFAPTSVGTSAGTLTITGDASNRLQTVSLSDSSA